MITVTKTPLPPLEEYTAYLSEIWRSGQLTNNGPYCVELRRQLAHRLATPNLELVGNGTLALQVAIRALGLAGEIITTPYSYVATTHAILWEGCDPVFVDIDPRTFCLDPGLIEAAITPRTSGILATHVYGYPCDVAQIQAIADRHGLKVIYDAAHAFDIKLNGASVLGFGDCSTLSFHATKIFHCAEGGAVACKSAAIAQRVLLMSKFGHLGEDEYLDVGINAKLSELHAALGLAMLPRVEDIIAVRKQCSAWYDEHLQGCDLQRPAVPSGIEYNYAYYPVVFPDHESMMRARRAMFDMGIGPRRYFTPSLNTLQLLRPELRASCPVSESIASRVLVLPMSSVVDEPTVKSIATIIRQALQ
jgi:dTDP-4-amino-4,6-dideoxygalactose transaminase